MRTLKPPFVFMSYASPDRDRVLPIRDYLEANGISVWMDVDRLLPGQHWEAEIKRGLDDALAVVVFVSVNSVDRTGYVQRELRMVFDKLAERPDHRIYAIPAVLDPEARIPDRLKELQYVAITTPEGRALLLKAVNRAFGLMEQAHKDAQSAAEVEWTFDSWTEEWEGLPGYEAEVTWPTYKSVRYPQVSQISDAIRSELQLMVAAERAAKLDQSPEFFSFGSSKVNRTNVLRVRCEDPVIRNHVLSQHLEIYWYGAGAMHGNYGFISWVFVLDPLVRVSSLLSVFTAPDDALAALQTVVRRHVLAHLELVAGREITDAERLHWMDDIISGTADWEALQNFGFTAQGLRILFPPYQVAPYSAGPISVEVPYSCFFSLLRRPYADALGLHRSDFEES